VKQEGVQLEGQLGAPAAAAAAPGAATEAAAAAAEPSAPSVPVSGHVWQNKCQGLAERVKEALKDVPLPPGGAYKIANLLRSGALTGELLLPLLHVAYGCFWGFRLCTAVEVCMHG
jgi:hypothetical protein